MLSLYGKEAVQGVMKLSIIIPVYNTENYLERCLASCLDQDLPESDYEIVVLNDGSTDGSLQVAQRIASSHPCIRIVSQENGGLSRARNAGLREAAGDYVWFVDSDDYIARNCVGMLWTQCVAGTLDVLGMGSYKVLPDGSVLERQYYDQGASRTIYDGPSAMRSGLLKSPCAPFYVMRRAYLLDKGLTFLAGYLHEDEEFTPRMFYQAGRISFVSECCYYACVRGNSITHTVNPKRAFDLIAIAGRLDSFSQGIDPDDRYLFSERIARTLDSVFKLCRDLPEEVTARVEKKLTAHPELTAHLRSCPVFKFQLAGALIKLFPKHPFAVYRTLLKLARR